MRNCATQNASDLRLRASPNFALAHTMDGRPYVAKETEPYIQYWLTEQYRVLLSMFSGRKGATVSEAIDGYLRLTRKGRNAPARRRLSKAVDDMRSAGVLVGVGDDTSRYDDAIVEYYARHRPFPGELARLIVERAPIAAASRVLDLAGGPGQLALQLASVSDHVALMELSRAFVAAASGRARQLGLRLQTHHESCNRLVHMDEQYDVITVSQALHWLDDVLVCRGVCRALLPQGSFFVIHSAIELDDHHPLSNLLGNNSVLGARPDVPFAAEVEALLGRLTLLFEALDRPDVQRLDLAQQWAGAQQRIAPERVSIHRQQRPFDLGYARAFLTPEHIASTGRDPAAFWQEIEARCANAKPGEFIGNQHWAVIHFRRGAKLDGGPIIDPCVTAIDYQAGC